jgi:hypothetical protein
MILEQNDARILYENNNNDLSFFNNTTDFNILEEEKENEDTVHNIIGSSNCSNGG